MEVRRLRKDVKESDWSEERGRLGMLALFVLEVVIVLLERGAGGDFVAAEFRGLVWEAEGVDAGWRVAIVPWNLMENMVVVKMAYAETRCTP
jgi:hypothetical protein